MCTNSKKKRMSIQNITTKSWLMPLATIVALIGAPYLQKELKMCLPNVVLKNSIITKLVVFSAVYLNTTDIYISFATTVLYAFFTTIILGPSLTLPSKDEKFKVVKII